MALSNRVLLPLSVQGDIASSEGGVLGNRVVALRVIRPASEGVAIVGHGAVGLRVKVPAQTIDGRLLPLIGVIQRVIVLNMGNGILLIGAGVSLLPNGIKGDIARQTLELIIRIDLAVVGEAPAEELVAIGLPLVRAVNWVIAESIIERGSPAANRVIAVIGINKAELVLSRSLLRSGRGSILSLLCDGGDRQGAERHRQAQTGCDCSVPYFPCVHLRSFPFYVCGLRVALQAESHFLRM